MSDRRRFMHPTGPYKGLDAHDVGASPTTSRSCSPAPAISSSADTSTEFFSRLREVPAAAHRSYMELYNARAHIVKHMCAACSSGAAPDCGAYGSSTARSSPSSAKQSVSQFERSLDSFISDLSQQLRDARHERDALKTELDASEQRIAHAHQQLTRRTAEFEEQEELVQTFGKAFEELQAKQASYDDALQRLRGLEALEVELEAATTRAATEADRADGLEAENGQLKELVSVLRLRLANLEGTFQEAGDKYASGMEAARTAYLNKVAGLTSEIATSITNTRRLEERLDKAMGNVDSKQNTIYALRDRLKFEQNNGRRRVRELRAMLKANDTKSQNHMAGLASLLAATTTSNRRLEGQVEERTLLHARAMNDKEQVLREKTVLGVTAQALTQQLRAERAQNACTSVLLVGAGSLLHGHHMHQMFNGYVASLRNLKIGHVAALFDERTRHLQAQQTKQAQHQVEVAQLRAQVEAAEAAKEAAQHEAASLREQIASMRALLVKEEPEVAAYSMLLSL